MFLPRIKTSGKINLLSRLPGDSIRYRPVSIGPFTVQAYAVDHAAPDAIAVLVEAEGKRLFYSGDFRSGGRTSFWTTSSRRRSSGSTGQGIGLCRARCRSRPESGIRSAEGKRREASEGVA